MVDSTEPKEVVAIGRVENCSSLLLLYRYSIYKTVRHNIMATTGATIPGTRTQLAEAFSHVIDNVLEWDATSPGRQYCVDQMYSKMGDLLNMDKAEINDMEYKKSKVSMKIKKQIKHLQAWFTWKSAQQTGGYVDATVWKALTSDEFETFCACYQTWSYSRFRYFFSGEYCWNQYFRCNWCTCEGF